MRRFLVPIVVTFMLVGMAGASDQVYRWLDDDGQVQYGAVPPQGVDATRVDLRASGSGDDTEAGGETAERTGDRSSAVDDDEADDARPDPDGLRAECRQIRRDLETLRESDTNRRFQREDGEVVRFSEEELAVEIERREDFVAAYCDALD